jgi:hypothetical protein
MATLQTIASSIAKPAYAGAGLLHALPWTYDFLVNPTAADIVQCGWLPAGAKVTGGFIYATDLDTGTEAMDMDLGWAANGGSGTYDAADPDGLGNFGVWNGDSFALGNLWNVAGQCWILAGILTTGVFPSFTKNTRVQLVVNVAANATGTGKLCGVVNYVVDPTIVA